MERRRSRCKPDLAVAHVSGIKNGISLRRIRGGVDMRALSALVLHLLQKEQSFPQQLVIFPSSSYNRRLIHIFCHEWKILCETDKKHPYCAMWLCGPPPGQDHPKCSGDEFQSCFGTPYPLFYYRMVLTLTNNIVMPPRQEQARRNVLESICDADLWSKIPQTALLEVVLNLSLDDMLAVFLTCKQWSHMADSSLLWFRRWNQLNVDECARIKTFTSVSHKLLVKRVVEARKVHAALCHECVPGIQHRHQIDLIDPCVELDCRGCKYGP